MQNHWKNFLALLTVLTVAACASASNHQTHPAHYAATTHIVLSDMLTPPPLAHSIADQKDLAAVLRAQHVRTHAQIKQAIRDAKIDISAFQSILGPRFNAKKLPITTAFFKNALDDEGALVEVAKAHYARPRPYTASALVKPIVEKLNNTSYPSGHSTFAYVTTTLLADMVPEKRVPLMARADQFAQNRVIAGVHYPTDVAAGKEAAAIIVQNWMNDPQFKADFNRAKRELRQAILKNDNIK